MVYCAEDESAPGSTSISYTVSPVHLNAQTLGDRLKGISPGSRNVAVAGKDRAAIMTASEITSMLESFYRVRAGTVDLKTTALVPRQFMGYPGFQWDFDHLDADEVQRRGRVVGAVIAGRLYLVLLDGTRMHYFADALPDFEAVVNSARFRS